MMWMLSAVISGGVQRLNEVEQRRFVTRPPVVDHILLKVLGKTSAGCLRCHGSILGENQIKGWENSLRWFSLLMAHGSGVKHSHGAQLWKLMQSSAALFKKSTPAKLIFSFDIVPKGNYLAGCIFEPDASSLYFLMQKKWRSRVFMEDILSVSFPPVAPV